MSAFIDAHARVIWDIWHKAGVTAGDSEGLGTWDAPAPFLGDEAIMSLKESARLEATEVLAELVRQMGGHEAVAHGRMMLAPHASPMARKLHAVFCLLGNIPT